MDAAKWLFCPGEVDVTSSAFLHAAETQRPLVWAKGAGLLRATASALLAALPIFVP